MIPDKLYLSPIIYGTITNISPNPDCEGEVEYIRKEALLEWLKGYNHPITQIVIQEVIDKIDSM